MIYIILKYFLSYLQEFLDFDLCFLAKIKQRFEEKSQLNFSGGTSTIIFYLNLDYLLNLIFFYF